MTRIENIYCARCGSEFDLDVKRTTSYSAPLHIPNLYCPFCGSRRLTKKKGIFSKQSPEVFKIQFYK